MYNILITDDEQIVIDSLFFIINKNFEGQVKLFSANNGADAIKICSQEKIDIIFMDINMPGMTGLEAIKCILNLKPQTVIIILSAFDTFQYAQEALNLGAFKYITKPVNRNLVVQTIRSAMNAVDTRQSLNYDGGELQKKLDKVTPVLENDFFYNCIFNRAKEEEIYTYLDYFNIGQQSFVIACFELTEINPANENELYSKFSDEMHSRIKCLVSTLLVNRVIVFFYFDKSEDQNADECFKEEMKNLYTILGIYVGRGIRCGVSKSFTDINSISEKYKFALDSLNSTNVKGELKFSDEVVKRDENDENSENILSRLYNRLRIGDTYGVSFLLRSYLEILEKNNRSLDYIKSEFFEILVNARNISREVDSKNTAFASSDVFAVISTASDVNYLYQFVSSKIVDISKNIHEIKSLRGNPIIAKVLKYIDENISKDISLDSAADVANVNPFYLSKLFREETGDTFINYISEKRMEMAKKLLLESDLSIKEITAEIGYNDQNYFSKLFKGRFGVSPTDFRKAK